VGLATGATLVAGPQGPSLPANSIALLMVGVALLCSRPFQSSPALVRWGVGVCAVAVSKQLAWRLGWINSPALPGNTLMICLLGLSLVFLGNRKIVIAQLAAALATLPPIAALISFGYQLPGCPSLTGIIVALSGLSLAVTLLAQTAYRGPLKHLFAPNPAGRLARVRVVVLGAVAIGLGYVAALLQFDPAAVPIIVTLMVATIVVLMGDIVSYSVRHARIPLAERPEGFTELEFSIDRALLNGEFRLAYQPQIELATGELAGIEVLVRWDDPTRGQVSPLEFVTAAEATGQIHAVGLWILEEACNQGQRWRDTPLGEVVLSVNVSPVQLKAPDFAANVRAILAQTGFPPDRLVVELTESALVQRGDPGFETLWELNQAGVRIAIDDFGTGYSCLAYLRDLPVSFLKIDQSFVRDLPDDDGAAVIARTVVAMGRGLGLSVVAEGVETEAQADFLKGIWCNKAQGYLYAKPLDSTDLGVWMTLQSLSGRVDPLRLQTLQ
jgi:EAL domain-containing protein (putative c-di-GMP-specific phosphodiesterase class I)